MNPRPPGRAAILALYLLVFWALLPALLWHAGRAIDDGLGWTLRPSPWAGLAPLLAGALLLASAMRVLWRDGGGLPIGALPPPRLARRGPYASMRHPIYVGFNLAIFGAGIALGSWGLALVVAPLFALVWVAWALLEERGLARRHGAAWRRYRSRVGLLPRFSLYSITRFAMRCRLLPARVIGREKLPPSGPLVLVANHATYADPLYVGFVTDRPVHFLTTAEAYRGGLLAWVVDRFANVPVRRYRADPVACREMLRLLAEGEVIGIFPEGERSVLGAFAGAQLGVARILARLGVPVVPLGISGNYDVGPRWAGRTRRRPVEIRVGEPLRWTGDPKSDLDGALQGLLGVDPQPVHLGGLDLRLLERVLWACPRCLGEAGWRADTLTCECGARWTNTQEGCVRDERGGIASLAELARPLWEAPEPAVLRIPATAWKEASIFGPIRPLRPLGPCVAEIGPERIAFAGLVIPLPSVRSVSTERADTVQIATAEAMFQLRLARGSAFRVHRAIERWRQALRETPPSPGSDGGSAS
jgi:1-acyl-sn-glycerol-3-phosphate acyltransferase